MRQASHREPHGRPSIKDFARPPRGALMDRIDAHDQGLTLQAYAAHKGFSVAKLVRWGVRSATKPFTRHTAVGIPYYDAAGHLLRVKYRTPTGTVWDDRRDAAPALYGLWRL